MLLLSAFGLGVAPTLLCPRQHCRSRAGCPVQSLGGPPRPEDDLRPSSSSELPLDRSDEALLLRRRQSSLLQQVEWPQPRPQQQQGWGVRPGEPMSFTRPDVEKDWAPEPGRFGAPSTEDGEKEEWTPEPGRFFGTPSTETATEKEWAPEPGRFFGTPVEDVAPVEEREKTRAPEGGRFFGDPTVVPPLPAAGVGGGLDEGYWAPLANAPDKLRASDLNELLQPDHLDRLRFTNSPLMAYGALFKWEVLVGDVTSLYVRPWAMVAAAHDLPEPDADDVMRMVGMRAERAIQQVFCWTDDWGFAQQLAFEHFENKASVVESFPFQCSEGTKEWLELLQQYSIPCCCCSSLLDESTARLAMSRAGLDNYFEAFVTAEDGCETAEQTYLLSSVKVRRPPTKCVVFEDDPRGIAAAHDSTTKVVAVMANSRSSGFDLRHADMRVSSLDDLSLMSMRELFKGEGGEGAPPGAPPL